MTDVSVTLHPDNGRMQNCRNGSIVYISQSSCNSLANSAQKRSTGTFGIFVRNAIMLIRLAVIN